MLLLIFDNKKKITFYSLIFRFCSHYIALLRRQKFPPPIDWTHFENKNLFILQYMFIRVRSTVKFVEKMKDSV